MPETRIVIVGTKHRGRDALAALAALPKGSPVELRREPDNHYDPGAIACWANSTHIGYLPRAQYGAIRAALDAGRDVSAALTTEAIVDRDDIAPGGLPRLTVTWAEED